MPSSRRLSLTAALVLLSTPVPSVLAQGSAVLTGTVTDPQGDPLPGVTVTLNSSAEVRKNLSTSTNQQGYFHMADLAPGDWELRFRLEGFAELVRGGITLNVGSQATVDATLQLAVVEESVVVVGEAPLVEATKSSVGEVISQRFIDEMPLQNRAVFDLVPIVAGAHRQPNTGQITSQGERFRGLNVIIDGIDNNDNVANFGQVLVDQYIQDTVQEMEVLTSGYNAEFGEASGAVVNVVTKSGSNRFHGRLFFSYRDDSLDSSPVEDQDPAALERHEYGFTLGGPVVRDRLWFYAASQIVDQTEGLEFDTSQIPEELNRNFFGEPENFSDTAARTDDKVFFLKATAASSQRHRLDASVMHFPNEKTNWVGDLRSGRPIGGNVLPSAGHSVEIPGQHYKLNHSWFISDRAFLQTNIGYLERDDINRPNESRTPWESFPNFQSGRFIEDPREFASLKFQIGSDLTYYVDDWAGDHRFKTGWRLINDIQRGSLLIHNAILYATDSRGSPVVTVQFRGVPTDAQGLHYDVELRSNSLYLQDSWRARPHLTINAGYRFDIMSPWNHPNHSPRLGFAWDPRRDGKTVVRGHVGRFFDQNSGNALLQDPEFGGFNLEQIVWLGVAPFLGGSGVPISSGVTEIRFLQRPLRTPFTDAFVLGVEREIAPGWSLSGEINWRDSDDVLSQRIVNWDSQTQSTTDGGPQLRALGYENWSEFRSFQVSVRRRFARNYQLLASYTYTDWQDISADSFNDLPDDEDNPETELGPAGSSIPHAFKLSGSWSLPRGFTVSAVVVAQSGIPYSAASVADLDGDGRLERPLEAPRRNAFRRNEVATLDARVAKAFATQKGDLEILVEGFNLLNRKNVRDVFSLYGADDFGEGQTFLQGRTLQLGARFTF